MTNFTHNILSIQFHFNNFYNSIVNNPVMDAPKRELFEKIQKIVAKTINLASEASHACTKDLETLKAGLEEFGAQESSEKAEAIKQLIGDIQTRVFQTRNEPVQDNAEDIYNEWKIQRSARKVEKNFPKTKAVLTECMEEIKQGVYGETVKDALVNNDITIWNSQPLSKLALVHLMRHQRPLSDLDCFEDSEDNRAKFKRIQDSFFVVSQELVECLLFKESDSRRTYAEGIDELNALVAVCTMKKFSRTLGLMHLLNDAINVGPRYILEVFGKTVDGLPAFKEWCEIVEKIDNSYVIDMQLTAIQETLHWVTDEMVPFVSKKLCQLATKIDNPELDPEKTLLELVLRVARNKPVFAEALLDGIDEVEYEGTEVGTAIKEFVPDVAVKVILRMKNIQDMDSERFDVNRFLRIQYERVQRTDPMLAFGIICKMTNIPFRIDLFFKFFQRFEYDVARIKEFSASIPKESLRQRFFCEAVRILRNYSWLDALEIVKWLTPGPIRDEANYLMAHSLNAYFHPPTAFTMLNAISDVDVLSKGFTEVIENESDPLELFGRAPHKVMTEEVLIFAFGAYSLMRSKLAFQYICRVEDNVLANYLYNIWITNLHANGKTEIAVDIVKEVVVESSQPSLLAQIEKLKKRKEDHQPEENQVAKKIKKNPDEVN